jgi:uncharacterized repeat protein (TIGR01451 family)
VAGNRGRARTRRWIVVLALGAVIGASVAAGTAGAAPNPSITNFAASTTTLTGTGGPVDLTATVADASTCKLTSNPTFAGLPVTATCSGGTFATTVTLPANPTLTAKSYTLKLTASRAGATSALSTVVITVAPTPAPAVQTFAPSVATLPNSGGSVDLVATVTDAATCKFTASPTVTGLPVTVACTGGSASTTVTLPANPAQTVKSYAFTLTVARPGGGSVASSPVTVTVGATPPPAATTFTATPTELSPSGGSVDIAATVTDATSCKLTVSPTLTGLPLTQPCSGGTFATTVTLPANTTVTAKLYTFKLTMSRTGGGAAVTSAPVVVTVDGLPVPTINAFTSTASLLPPAGGAIDLYVGASDATTCKFTVTPALAGFPLTLPCTAGYATTNVTLPANSTTAAKTYTFKVTASRAGAPSVTATPLMVEVATTSDPVADLTVSGSASDDAVVVPGDATHTFTVTNAGPDPAAATTFTGTLGDAASFVTATPSQGTPCTVVTTTVTCALGAIPSGGSATVAIDLHGTHIGSLYVTGSAASTVNDFTPETNLTSTFTLVTEPKIVYSDDSTQQIYTMTGPFSGSTPITTSTGAKSDPVVSPNHRLVAYWRQNPTTFASEVWVVGTDGSNEHYIGDVGTSMVPRPSWSADSTTIAYTSVVGGMYKATVASAVGAPNPHLLIADTTYGEMSPTFSPDGSTILFVDSCLRPAPEQCRSMTVDAAGLTTPVAYTTYPIGRGAVWSPDGQWFYFATQSGTIYRAKVDGSLAEPVASNLGGGLTYWSLSPQGDRIAYTEYVGGKNVISTVDVDGTNHQQLTAPIAGADPAGCYSPAWRFDESAVVMHCYRPLAAISVDMVSTSVSSPTPSTIIGGGFRSRNPEWAGSRPTN